MKTVTLPGDVDFDAVVDALYALDKLASSRPGLRDAVASMRDDVLTEGWDASLALFIEYAAAYVERSQRFVDRFQAWRAYRTGQSRPSGYRFSEIGSPDRPLRRVHGETYDPNAILATVVVVRMRDRENGTSHAPRFIATLARAYRGWSSGIIAALLAYAVRDRRVARRFRSWRRAVTARAAAPRRSPRSPSGPRRHRGVR
jgi:hypothetical protein